MKKLLLLILFLIVLFLGGCFGWTWYRDNRASNFGRTAEIYVRPEDSASDVLEAVCSSAQVKDRKSLERSFRDKKVAENLKPGHYTVSATDASVYVARMLNNGWQTPVKLTLAGNLRIKQNIAAKISSQMLADSASVYAALCDDALLGEFGFCSRNAFSMLMPATYEMWWTATPEDILRRMKEAWDAFWTASNDGKAAQLGLSREQVSVLASIVKAESNYEPEMPLIAGVYLNRLSAGMPLQADPTVAFCFDYKPQRILHKHLEVDSPYNTYRHPGLPPGPICVPSKAALEAVLNPDYGGERGKGNFYFCANPDFSGRHIFARTLSEHNANARAFQAELTRRARAKRGS